jgi:hypothetical protein
MYDMHGNVGGDWASLSHEEREERFFRRVCSQLQTAKTNGDRVSAGGAYNELHAKSLNASSTTIRQNAADMIDQVELDWYLADIARAAPIEAWFYERIRAYDRAAPESKRRASILAQIRRIAEADGTPETVVPDLLEFLAAPDAWYAPWRENVVA